MPCIGFICPRSLDNVPFDHFEHCDHGVGGRPAVVPWMARQIAQGQINDIRHSGLNVTSTRCLSCPRSTYIKYALDYRINPKRLAAAARGTANHKAAAEQFDPQYWVTEVNDRVACEVTGRMFKELVGQTVEADDNVVTADGIRIDTVIDAIRRQRGEVEIVNLKFPNDMSTMYRDKPPFSCNNQVQLNIERRLLEQTTGETVDKMTVWDHAMRSGDMPRAVPIDPLTDEELVKCYPGLGRRYNVGDIVSLAATVAQLAPTNDVPEDVRKLFAACIPCVGESQWPDKDGVGRGCTNYCDVNRESEALVRRFGRPEVISDNPLGDFVR